MKADLWGFIFFAAASASQAQERPRHLIAAEIASAHFQNELSNEKYSDVEYSTLSSDIENYSVGISFNKESFVIVFIPKLAGYDIEGGSAKYVIRKKDMAIVEFIKYK
jgi:hypothetical protein